MTDDIDGQQLAYANSNPYMTLATQSSNPYVARSTKTTPSFVSHDNYHPGWTAALNTVAGAIPGIVSGNPYMAAIGLLKGVGGWEQANSYNKQNAAFNHYKEAYNQDQNIPAQIKPYIQNSNSYDQINDVMGKVAPQLGNFNMSNGMVGQLNGQPNKDAFPTGTYVDPKSMQTYINDTESKPLQRGTLPENINYQQPNPYEKVLGNNGSEQPNPYEQATSNGQVATPQINSPSDISEQYQESKNNIEDLGGYDGIKKQISNPYIPISERQYLQKTLNNHVKLYQQYLKQPQSNSENITPVSNQTISGGVTGGTTMADYNPYTYMASPNYYSEAKEQQFKQNPYTNMQAYESQQNAIKQQNRNPYESGYIQSQIDEKKADTNYKNVEAKYIPEKVGIEGYNAQTGRINAETGISRASETALNNDRNYQLALKKFGNEQDKQSFKRDANTSLGQFAQAYNLSNGNMDKTVSINYKGKTYQTTPRHLQELYISKYGANPNKVLGIKVK